MMEDRLCKFFFDRYLNEAVAPAEFVGSKNGPYMWLISGNSHLPDKIKHDMSI